VSGSSSHHWLLLALPCTTRRHFAYPTVKPPLADVRFTAESECRFGSVMSACSARHDQRADVRYCALNVLEETGSAGGATAPDSEFVAPKHVVCPESSQCNRVQRKCFRACPGVPPARVAAPQHTGKHSAALAAVGRKSFTRTRSEVRVLQRPPRKPIYCTDLGGLADSCKSVKRRSPDNC
jgi:hypothetical protein